MPALASALFTNNSNPIDGGDLREFGGTLVNDGLAYLAGLTPGGTTITGNGTITTISTRLRGHSLVQASNGTINFHGNLNPGSHAVFRNTNGAIGITLPSHSSVLVDARTPLGSINSQFSSVRVAASPRGRVAVGRIGRDATAHLRLETVHGSIDLNRGS